MAQIGWTERAILQLEKIRNYVSRDNPDAAHRVVESIYQRVQMLRSFPRLGQQILAPGDRELREILYGHYRIFYEIKSEKLIEVISIFHSAANLRDYLDLE